MLGRDASVEAILWVGGRGWPSALFDAVDGAFDGVVTCSTKPGTDEMLARWTAMDTLGPGIAAGEEYLLVAGQELRLTNPDRVLYPATGTTKTDVIGYWLAVAPRMLPHLAGRPATRKRWPQGVDGPAFFVKQVEAGIPVWLSRVQVTQHGGGAFYPVLDTPAALAWLGQVSALEVHVPQWRIADPAGPRPVDDREPLVDRVVFDLDPGEGTGLAECVEVAWALRDRLGVLGERLVPVSSGSKGLHVYVPMDEAITSGQASDWARLAAEQLEQALPDLVVSTMSRTVRRGKVFIDWSQNNGFKTTIAPYSLRGRDRPTVAAPRTWDELTPGMRHLELGEVMDRVARGLDPMAALLDHPRTADVPPAPAVVLQRRPPARPVVVGGGRPPGSASGLVLPAGLAGPVQVALAAALDRVPGPAALPGGSRYEPKWDGFRTSAVGGLDGVRLWSKNGTDLSHRFPEISRAATAVVPEGAVLDGEAVIWVDERLRFDLLQRRLTTSRTRLAQEARAHPASYMVFDLLAVGGRDLRGYPWRTRRTLLEELARDWPPPLQLSPVTADEQLARQWMTRYRPAGVEGLVVKGADSRYEPGKRRWVKIRQRDTVDLAVGAVVGTLSAPTAFVAGLYDTGGTLRMVGRSTTLSRPQARSLAVHLVAAAADHPWPDTLPANRFGGDRDRVALTRVEPTVVVEVAADAAREHGIWRHGLRFSRIRPDMTVHDLPVLDKAAIDSA